MTERPTNAQLDDLDEMLKSFDKAIAAIHVARKPLDDALSEIKALQEVEIERVLGATEIIGRCESCKRLLIAGDKGHTCGDGPVLCEGCAPTWGDIKAMIERDPDSIEHSEPGDLTITRANVAAHEAAGTLDTKHVWTL